MEAKLKELQHNRRRMMRRPTKAERHFKSEVMDILKIRYGIKYQFQKIVFETKNQKDFKGYILDFYLPKYKLCIEIDGKSHNGKFQKQYDEIRESLLGKKGIKIIRISNNDVQNTNDCFKNLYGILEERNEELKKRQKRATKIYFRGHRTIPPLDIDREKELDMQAKYIAENGIKILPTIRANRKFKLIKGQKSLTQTST